MDRIIQDKKAKTKIRVEKSSQSLWAIALILVGLFALGFRWYYVANAMVAEPVRGDAIQYYAYAWNLVHHGVFSKALPGSAHVVSDSFRDPAYPLFLALAMKNFASFDAWYPIVLLAQALLGALTVVLLMATGRRWLSDRWLIVAGLAMAIWPHSVTMTSFLLTETLFGFFCALGLFSLARSLDKSSPMWASIAGIAFGMGALTNAVLIPFGPLLAAWLLLRSSAPKKLLLILMAVTITIPLAWGIRGAQLPPGESSEGRATLNFVQGSWPDYHSSYIQSVMGNPDGARTMLAIQSEYEVLHASPVQGLSLIAARFSTQPFHYLWWYLRKPALLWDWGIRMGQGDIYVYPTVNSPFNDKPFLRALVSVCQAINPLMMLLAFIGAIMAFGHRSNQLPITKVLALFSIYVTLIYSLLQSEPRYSIPFKGIEILLAVSAISQISIWLAEIRSGSRNPRGSFEAPA